MASSRAHGPARIRGLLAAYAGVVALFTASRLPREPYDDSYFFERFAANALDHGVLAWNVRDGPVYGTTSQLFQFVEIALTALARDHTVLITRGFLALCLVAAAAGLAALSARTDRGVAALLALCSPPALFSVLSGMETALVFALLAAFLWLLYGAPERARPWSAAPIAVFLIWLARPDAALLALPPLIVERWRATRRLPLRELLVLGAAVGAALLAFKLYYGTALPLPFYAKQRLLTPYDADFLRASAAIREPRFAVFLLPALPLALAALLRRDATNWTLLGAAAAFAGYHWLTTVEVMGMQGRFYAPALPLLAVAASRAFDGTKARPKPAWVAALVTAVGLALLALAGRFPLGSSADAVPVALYVASAVSAAAPFVALLVPALRRRAPFAIAGVTGLGVAFGPFAARAPLDDAHYLARHAANVTVYRGMDVLLDCFGDRLHVYHSEVGVPGLRFLQGTVTDLAGLMNPEWLLARRGFDAMCLRDRPEAIFLPHRNYVALNREIRGSQCLRGYERVIDDSSSPLYVRGDLAARYRRCRENGGAAATSP